MKPCFVSNDTQDLGKVAAEALFAGWGLEESSGYAGVVGT